MSEPSFPDARRRIVGETWISVDVVVKETLTKNTSKSVIHRRRTRAILLECGHALEVTLFKKVPTISTICQICDLPRLQREIDARLKPANPA